VATPCPSGRRCRPLQGAEYPLIVARGPVSRVLSRRRYPAMPDRIGGGSHSSGPCVAARLKQPTRAVAAHARGETPRPSCEGAPPLFGLAPDGVCHAGPVASAPVRSCRTLSPLPVPCRERRGHRRFALCGTFPRLPPDMIRSRRAGVTRHPCFVEPGLSSNACAPAAARPPGKGYLASPRSRSKSSWNRIARNSPSI